MYLPKSPIVRPFLTFAVLCLALYSLLAHWEQFGGPGPHLPGGKEKQVIFQASEHDSGMHNKPGTHGGGVPAGGDHGHHGGAPASGHNSSLPRPILASTGYERRVVAHFMLGNTYPFTEKNWEDTFDLAEKHGLDGLALNLGPEDWQLTQARVAYDLASRRHEAPRDGRKPIELFFSLDMNVLAHQEWADATALGDKIAPLLASKGQMLRGGRPILSSFAGHDVYFGARGWKGFLVHLNNQLRKYRLPHAFFWPAFFMPPQQFVDLPYVDGTFAWNNAWPKHTRLTLKEDTPFMDKDKPYMAAISPLFFTHYGKTGEWAFDKNFIYPSDNMLYPSRWAQFMALGDGEGPEMVQIISWNDYGESHAIAPSIGAQPGSEAWTNRMDHVAFLEMTKYFADRWRNGAPEVGDEIVFWMWYRTHPKALVIESDPVGRPDNADMASDLLNFVALIPEGLSHPLLILDIGSEKHPVQLTSGRFTALRFPFTTGPVHFKLESAKGLHLRGAGHHIDDAKWLKAYNFNMWSGAWHAKV
ncbi:hypothetical protein Q8F55_000660 [Vanrija albida]|uniref:Glycoside hydrolase family 71 protein n=1 Tax=Vanrija albida TaxID=181172 RepID=A0ABR3QDX0_9TREE